MEKQQKKHDSQHSEKTRDEDIGVMIYGNVKIKDLDTGKILVNQRA